MLINKYENKNFKNTVEALRSNNIHRLTSCLMIIKKLGYEKRGNLISIHIESIRTHPLRKIDYFI